jgi:hypothetical protein
MERLVSINKKLWTSSYVLFAAGCALVALGLLSWLVKEGAGDRWSYPWLVFGTNAIAAYVLSEILAVFIYAVHISFNGETHHIERLHLRACFCAYPSAGDGFVGFRHHVRRCLLRSDLAPLPEAHLYQDLAADASSLHHSSARLGSFQSSR